MSQKHTVVLFIVLLLVGLLSAVGVKFKNELVEILIKKETATQTPSSADYFFETNKQKDPNALSTADNLSTISDLVSGKAKLEPPQNKITTTIPKTFNSFPGVYSNDQLKDKAAIIQTKKGNVYIYLFPETPLTTSNFIFLVTEGFYDGLKFHRVEKDFVVQGGDPKGDGTGGPGYKFADEKVIGNYVRGAVAMANAGVNTNGSQFFIVLKDQPTLPPKYTIFGKVFKGIEVVDKLEVGDVMEHLAIVSIVQDNK